MRITREVRAPRAVVYRLLVDGDAVCRWRVPEGMTGRVHEFDARPGGRFRLSLTYDSPAGQGKTSGATDTYGGHFAELVDGERVVEVIAFESADVALSGELRMTTEVSDAPGGCVVAVSFEGLPGAISAEDNATGTRMALDKLAALAEGDAAGR
ncbi:SRPBCC domain-containing protein [Actinokineospora bangkokensis]|uniref:Polyketide cyclase n=1 Tax=Actinokineospora bangkokensis TaxID=1193682 RepID=A0A1Q9LLB4_9PSEU|nr:SRPBCC domain-containing protein [Actinokineospora bangkokensis]OLR92822.1 polyketide cyclase [Actinokineospora bangkokensis]